MTMVISKKKKWIKPILKTYPIKSTKVGTADGTEDFDYSAS